MVRCFTFRQAAAEFTAGKRHDHGDPVTHQLISPCMVAVYSFVAMLILVHKCTVGLRVDEKKEVNGIVVSCHGGLVYDYSHRGGNPAELNETSNECNSSPEFF
ncbi:hypothetical protein PHYPSEUDO_014453 [Phytophthora pseudosyringae]|uniref:Uncharacterized protein n=1 Tax=Phytophthora pseudosyringae TaxID=221518 RepID=A0A8T1V4Y4_9STRA|nr:hypothetical protein PHYPSEUDO_014450 [Phytophthora pseudosyringae]KAG7376095.1 hypothetical protein PHYPSEUDO_014453 [Phytophthora pseudosyringae]